MVPCGTRRRSGVALLVSTLTILFGVHETARAQSGVQKKTYEFKEAGKAMEYALFVPSGYDKDKKTPLIVALHGLGGNPQQMIRAKGLTEQAEKRGYLVVAPMGYNSGGWYGALGPGKGFGKGFGKGKAEDIPENLGELSEKDVMNVLALVRRDYNVDEKRIYLIGHSMGGAGTYHLGAKHAEIWAGLAPIAAATGRPKNVEKLKDIPVFVIHGDNDTLVKVASARTCVEKLKEHKIVHEYLEIEGGGHGDVIGKGIPKIFDFFEKHAKKADKKADEKDDKKSDKKEEKNAAVRTPASAVIEQPTTLSIAAPRRLDDRFGSK